MFVPLFPAELPPHERRIKELEQLVCMLEARLSLVCMQVRDIQFAATARHVDEAEKFLDTLREDPQYPSG